MEHLGIRVECRSSNLEKLLIDFEDSNDLFCKLHTKSGSCHLSSMKNGTTPSKNVLSNIDFNLLAPHVGLAKHFGDKDHFKNGGSSKDPNCKFFVACYVRVCRGTIFNTVFHAWRIGSEPCFEVLIQQNIYTHQTENESQDLSPQSEVFDYLDQGVQKLSLDRLEESLSYKMNKVPGAFYEISQ